MAVLVEGISVIVLRARVESRYPGGWAGFVSDCPNATLCADSNLARVGFMTSADVQVWIDRLVDGGLEFLRDGVAVDIGVVDQLAGVTVNCSWLEVGTVDVPDGAVRACRLVGDTVNTLFTPDGWTYAGSL